MESMQAVTIKELWYYPVKSMKGIRVERAPLAVPGFPFDRQFMVVDDDGKFVTQRRLPNMATILPRVTEETLTLSVKGHEDISIDIAAALSEGQSRQAHIFDTVCHGIDLGKPAREWLLSVLGEPPGGVGLHLLGFDKRKRRAVSPTNLKGENSHTYFADGYPYLVASEATLAHVNEALANDQFDAVPMSRFRPNIVIDGTTAFDEFEWETLQLPEKGVVLGCRKPCQRCEIVTVDQLTGTIPKKGRPLGALVKLNPLKSLGKKGGYFGMNITLVSGEGQTLCVGDTLEIVRAQA